MNERRMMLSRVGLLLPMLMLLPVPDAASAPPPVRVKLISAAIDGAPGNGESSWPSLSADGRQLVFESAASNLVPDDDNGVPDIFVYDQVNGTIEMASVSSAGLHGNFPSMSRPSISANGRFVAFSSMASNLVPNDTNGTWDIFVRDRVEGTTERVSVSSDGAQADHFSVDPVMSADGRLIAFHSLASNLVPGPPPQYRHAYVFDRVGRTTERVSIGWSGEPAEYGTTGHAAMSADGRFIAFNAGGRLLPGQEAAEFGLFIRDLHLQTNERLSVAVDGGEGNAGSAYPSISEDGRYVSFYSEASDLVSGDLNDRADIFLRDRVDKTTRLVSVSSGGLAGNADVGSFSSITLDGELVAFSSGATNTTAGDHNNFPDIFVHDVPESVTERVSLTPDGTETDGYSDVPSMSGDGRYIAFLSSADNLLGTSQNEISQVFLRDLAPLRPVELAYVGQTSEIRGRTAILAATLEHSDGTPIANSQVRFKVGSFEVASTTSEEGRATASMPVTDLYGSYELTVAYDGDEAELLASAEARVPFLVRWEHEFTDQDRAVRLNRFLGELQFSAPGDVSSIRGSVSMPGEALPTGDTLISVDYSDEELEVTGRFVPERDTFFASVRTSNGSYVLQGIPFDPPSIAATGSRAAPPTSP